MAATQEGNGVLSGQGLPPALKPIATFLQRAKEIAPREPAVAYYARLYALQQAVDLRPRMDKADMPVLMELMDAVEEEKKNLDLSGIDDPSVHVENFAQELFARADEADRQGPRDMKVARAFYASSVIVDVCRQFGALSSDLQDKHKYARWRFVEISKATKEGREPSPPPDLTANDLLFPSTESAPAPAAPMDGDATDQAVPPERVSALSQLCSVPSNAPSEPTAPAPAVGVEQRPPDAAPTAANPPRHAPGAGQPGATPGYPTIPGQGVAVPPSPAAVLPPPPVAQTPHGSAAPAPPAPAPPSGNGPTVAPAGPTAPSHGPHSAVQHSMPRPPHLSGGNYPQPPPPPPPSAPVPPQATFPAPVPVPPPAPVHPDAIFIAQRHAKFAVSALQHSDLPMAIQNLRTALALLTGTAPGDPHPP